MYSRVVLVGPSWEAVELLDFFSRRFARDQVVLLGHREWSEDHLFYPGPCVDRGGVSGELLEHCIPEITLRRGRDALFYKDQKFRSFGGRAKPCELKQGEAHFRLAPNFFDPKMLLNGNASDKMALARELYTKAEIRKIALVSPTDLIERVNFKLTLSDHQDLECEYLYYGGSPCELLSLVDQKGRGERSFIEFCSQFEQSFSLVATFEFDAPVIPITQTLFIPQSQTHDWGHFIVEVLNHPGSTRQLVKACCRMSAENVAQAEEVAKKLRLLQRTLQRLFSEFSLKKCREKVYLLDYFPFSSPVDRALGSLPHFACFGWNAPLDQAFLQQNEIAVPAQSIFNNARSLLSIKQIQSKF